MPDHKDPSMANQGVFPKTRWSLVRSGQSQQSTPALNELCAIYRTPIVLSLQRIQRLSASDAEDEAQEFLVWFLEKNHLQEVDMNLGRFRTFLLRYLHHFMGNRLQVLKAMKRGGQVVHTNVEEQDALAAASDDFLKMDREWALATVEVATQKLRSRFSREYDVLVPFLNPACGDKPAPSQSAVAALLGKSEAAFRMLLHRFRSEFRDLLQQAVRDTVTTPEDFEDELRLCIRLAFA